MSRLAAALVALVVLTACVPSSGLPSADPVTVESPTPTESPSPTLPPPPVLPSISFPPIPSASPSPTGHYRRLVGTVQDADPCPALLVGTERWALTGDLARTLVDGTRMEVRGPSVDTPRGCGNGRALQVMEARPR